ncbi:plasmid recombination enzyme family protein, partial [Salmonella enterica]|nr:plasmid recombination enzyme family protein [Salmonella enterica]ELO1716011.1 plasmid recombination enzyme family protein [Salmonella enterica]
KKHLPEELFALIKKAKDIDIPFKPNTINELKQKLDNKNDISCQRKNTTPSGLKPK